MAEESKSESKPQDFKTTKDIKVSEKIVGQVIGQEDAVNVIKKASLQRRHVLLIGEPGTGKSMLGLALAELLPKEKLVDVLAFPNPNDENQPLIRVVPGGEGRVFISKARVQGEGFFKNQNIILFILAILAMIAPWWVRHEYLKDGAAAASIMFAAFFMGGMVFLAAFVLFLNLGKRFGEKTSVPKLIVDNFQKKQVPFFDATGAHAGALLGDVLHDPFQSGGLGTPSHERVVAGMIHKANMGVLFIDEIATLQPHTQQELLTSLQEGKYSITGQSERSAGAMVRTEP
ncbi:MAG: sigma 54-interacting transcriptional regulator, partial [Nanoarchaeota archaeon]|nr:sigma 54-interacting transcriptional regulator [Nanoarchaeota archaeon]